MSCPVVPPTVNEPCIAGAICEYLDPEVPDDCTGRQTAFCASADSTWHLGIDCVDAEGSPIGAWESSVSLMFAEVSGDCDDLFEDMAYDTVEHTLENLTCAVESESVSDCRVEQELHCTYEDAMVDLTLALDWDRTQWVGTGHATALMPSNSIDCTSTYNMWAKP